MCQKQQIDDASAKFLATIIHDGRVWRVPTFCFRGQCPPARTVKGTVERCTVVRNVVWMLLDTGDTSYIECDSMEHANRVIDYLHQMS